MIPQTLVSATGAHMVEAYRKICHDHYYYIFAKYKRYPGIHIYYWFWHKQHTSVFIFFAPPNIADNPSFFYAIILLASSRKAQTAQQLFISSNVFTSSLPTEGGKRPCPETKFHKNPPPNPPPHGLTISAWMAVSTPFPRPECIAGGGSKLPTAKTGGEGCCRCATDVV